MWREAYSSAEIQIVYSTAPANWAGDNIDTIECWVFSKYKCKYGVS